MMKWFGFIYIGLTLSCLGVAADYSNVDALRLDNPAPGTEVTLNVLGCGLEGSPQGGTIEVKCLFRRATQEAYIRVSREEAKSIISRKGYHSVTCKISEIGSSYAKCATVTEAPMPATAKVVSQVSAPQKSASVGWVFTKMKSDKIYERFSACKKEKASFEGHLRGESDMWSSRGAACAASHFFEDKEFIFECKYPRLGNSTRYYFWHDTKAKCEARLTQVKERWKKEKLD